MITCDSFHEQGGMRCVRRKGHAGRCCSRWEPVAGSPRRLQRGEWISSGGKFVVHYAYVSFKAGVRAAHV